MTRNNGFSNQANREHEENKNMLLCAKNVRNRQNKLIAVRSCVRPLSSSLMKQDNRIFIYAPVFAHQN